MSNALAKVEGGALALSEDDLISVLQTSLYPGASIPSIKMVLGYCKAAGLDPLQKPVHIVPMYDRASKGMRDVVMPGVGLYRTQAARTGQFAGMSEPEFGPDVERDVGGVKITYPEWARVTVKRALASGIVAEFTAREYWTENYAVKGGAEKSIAPNTMWQKRPRGQIAKCAAAQALRIAFPELGAQATAEELEGKELEGGHHEAARPPPAKPELQPYSQQSLEENLPKWQEVIASGRKTAQQIIDMVQTRATLTAEQITSIRELDVVDVPVADEAPF